MEPKKIKGSKGPEAIIQEAIVAKLRMLGWVAKETHGNMYQWGFPDIYAAHKYYGARWIEVKDPNRRGDLFTGAQHEFFHQLAGAGIGIWVLVSADDTELARLHGPPNWYTYLSVLRHRGN